MPEANDKFGLQVPFGAVYYRKSNPPREDWERDYGVASEDGLNIFRHWFMWSAIEKRPGVYDWDEWDRHLDLAAENGIATIIAEFSMAAPHWLQRKLAHARQCDADGVSMKSSHSVSVAVGGFGQGLYGAGVLTLNDPDVHAAVMNFLTEMAARYRGHPGLLGYDVNNEVNYQPNFDYSAPTIAAFRRWLQEKYGDVETLGEVWRRYSYADWEDVEAPRDVRPYPEGLDWLAFRRDSFFNHVQDKIDTIRAADPDAKIISHGIAATITAMARHGADDWRAAEQVEVYGYTWIAARKGNQPWRNFFAGDLIRGAARGKPYWHAERQGGPLWMQPQVLGRDREDGRIAEAEDVRLWSLASFATGARGMMNLRYRPLLDGPLWGAFGSYGMDGSRTDRSNMASGIAKWLNASEQRGLVEAKPVKGEIALLVVPETQEFDALLSAEGGFLTYSEAMWGAYRGFFEMNVQADWLHIDDIDAATVIYAPYPIMLPSEMAARIAAWVESGGTLICEACPGYFGDRGHVGTSQPNNGLDAVFGARESHVEFMPDIADRERIDLNGEELRCGGFRQVYESTTGNAVARFSTVEEGTAIVENSFGKGRTLLIGSHVSAGHFAAREAGERGNDAWWRWCLDWAGVSRRVQTSNTALVGRLHEGEAGRFLWIVNPTRNPHSGQVTVDGKAISGRAHWGDQDVGGAVTVQGRDALVVALDD